jgi:hypothetical protein
VSSRGTAVAARVGGLRGGGEGGDCLRQAACGL